MTLCNSDAVLADARCGLQVPEARAIWLLIVSITTLVSPGNFETVRPSLSQ
jgi:hypothetical protein